MNILKEIKRWSQPQAYPFETEDRPWRLEKAITVCGLIFSSSMYYASKYTVTRSTNSSSHSRYQGLKSNNQEGAIRCSSQSYNVIDFPLTFQAFSLPDSQFVVGR